MQKTYVAIVRDHSGSMSWLRKQATQDYNVLLNVLQDAASAHKQDTIATVIKCGVPTLTGYAGISREHVLSSLNVLRPLKVDQYDTAGSSTPLFDSVGDAIEVLRNVPDANDPRVAFLIQVITDGQENSSMKWNNKTLNQEIQRLQATDRWTFTFRVPHGYGRQLSQYLGLPMGNILEWEQSEQGLEKATVETVAATQSYFVGRSRGVTSTKGFYQTDMANVKPSTVKSAMTDISGEVEIAYIAPTENDIKIKDFVEGTLGKTWKLGTAFYQLTKTERNVQNYKKIVIRDKASGKVYGGHQARTLLGLPTHDSCKVVPGDHGQYDIFIQSTSTNRKLKEKTFLLLWDKAA